MKKTMVILTVLVFATAGYAASYVSDFEDGTSQGWLAGGTSTAVNPGIGVGGSYAVAYARSDSDTYLSNTNPVWGSYTNLESLLGAQMEMSFYMAQSVGSTGGSSNVRISLWDSWGGTTKWEYDWATPATTTLALYSTGLMDATWTDTQAVAAGWVQLSGTTTFRDTLRNLLTTDIKSNGRGTNGYDGPIVDNITVGTYVPIPEPVTLSVLALGLVGVLARRRR